ncbi:MAG: hypothetical protein ABSG31_14515 [Tepidisphaeraceae bacterium]|jgi:hypothetical protein
MGGKSTISVGLAVWLVWQWLALAIAAARVPLSARYPAAGEQWGLVVMLVAQIAAASLLFQILLPNWIQLIVIIAVAWPMGLLSAFLADANFRQWAWGEAAVSAWLLELFLLNRIGIPVDYLAAIVSLLTFGGPLAWYLHADFIANASDIDWHSADWLGPIMAIAAGINDGGINGAGERAGIFFFAAFAIACAGFFILKKTFLQRT